MIHRRMLITAIILTGLGFVLWIIIGPLIAYLGIGSYTTGWWIFSETHYYLTPLGYVGVGLAIAGLIILVTGIILFPITAVLEYTDRKRLQQPPRLKHGRGGRKDE